MQKITVVIRVDAGAVIITPEIVESALNTYLAENGNVTVFHAAQQSVQSDLLPCGHSSDNLGNFGGCNPMGSCVICDAATSR